MQILKQKGFKNVKIVTRADDLEAEKDACKTVNIGFSGSWIQPKQLHFDQFLPGGHKAVSMFVTEKGYYLIFQMTDARTI